jgi:hypothetical protein
MQKFIYVSIAIVCTACAAKPVMSGAERVMLLSEAPQGCEFLGEVVGSQGNWWTDDVTSTKNKMVGARNELRNLAYAKGATHVHIMESENTQSRVSFDVTNTTIIGNAYKCNQAPGP